VGSLHERSRLGLLAHIGGQRERAAALLRDARGERVDAIAAPARAQASAVASPIPDEAPVTATT
jgi:hypothetical protein